MSVFTAKELAYLREQRIGRLATVDAASGSAPALAPPGSGSSRPDSRRGASRLARSSHRIAVGRTRIEARVECAVRVALG